MPICWAAASSISAACAAASSRDMSGWDQVWLASRCPWAAIARTVAGQAFSLMPMSKKVARTCFSARTRSIATVLRPGPSSKVSATVRPVPGAVRCTPSGAGGQPTARVETVSGGATVAGSAASTSDGGHGPGSASVGGGCGGTGAAWAAGPVITSARTDAMTSSARPLRRACRLVRIPRHPSVGVDAGELPSRARHTGRCRSAPRMPDNRLPWRGCPRRPPGYAGRHMNEVAAAATREAAAAS